MRAKGSGAIRFTLSKASTVSVTIVRRDKAVLARSARFGYGEHKVGFRPPKAGDYDVRLRAVDLAGNVGTAAATLSVRPAKPKPH
jgi:hypothetical protein